MTPPIQPDFPVSTYRMGFAAGTLDAQASIAWTDITTFTHTDGIERFRVLGRRSTAGRKEGQTTVDTSRGVYTVDNRDGAFTPENAASPFYPNVRLDVIFQELQTWSGTTYTVYTGFVDDYDIQADELGRPVVVISCSDAQSILRRTQLEGSMWDIEVRKDVAANIAAGHHTAWLPLDDASNSDIAKDYGGQGWDGVYQNSPILGVKSLVAGSTKTCMDVAHSADQRMNLPYKDLITGFPHTIEMVLRVFQNRSDAKMIFSALDSPVVSHAGSQYQVFIQADADPTNQGRVVWLIANPFPTGSERISTIAIDDGVVHHLALVATSPSSLHIWIDGSDFSGSSATSSIAFPTNFYLGYSVANMPAVDIGDYGMNAGSSIDQFGNEVDGGIQSLVVYDGLALSPARISKHAQAAVVGWGSVATGTRVHQVLDSLGWPTADRAVEAGKTVVPNIVTGATPLDYFQLLAQTEGGRFFVSPEGFPAFQGRNHPLTDSRGSTSQATFADNGTAGTIPYVPPFEPHLDNIDYASRASVTRLNGTPQIFDATPGSTAAKISTKTGLLMSNDADARAMAQHDAIVGQSTNTRLRSLVFQPQADPTVGWPAALGLRQGDRITVMRHWEDGSAWTGDWVVEGIDHAADSGEAPWTTTLALSPVDPASYVLWDVTPLDSGARLFY